jgi:hypothetical protein
MQRFDHGAAVLAAFFILLGGVPEARAQKVEITPFVGYQFGGEVAVRNGNLRISDDVNYGLILDVTVNRTGQVEASYTRQDTRLVFDEFRVGKRPIYDVAVQYWQIGGLYRFNPTATVRPFFSLTLGLTHFGVGDKLDEEAPQISSESRFSTVLGGGVKIFPSERVGVRLQGHLYSTFLSSSSGFWCSVPGGCGVGLSGWAIWQGDVSAGLTIAM